MRRLGDFSMLGMAFFLWLCTVPVVILLLRPVVGSEVSFVVALAALAVYLAVCLALCRFRPPGSCGRE